MPMITARIAIVLALTAFVGGSTSATRGMQTPTDRLTASVDPFIGTGGHGHTYPGPSLPFGMIQPGPDTRLTGWDSCAGYHYSDTRIIGFSHTHLSGTGIPDYGDILLMPTTSATGYDVLARGSDGLPNYASTFSHAEEEASPGYYAVTLRDSGVRVQLTTTLRVGLHRYVFPPGRPQQVVLDLTHRDEVIDSSAEFVGHEEIAGNRRSKSWAKDQRLFYVIRFSRPFGQSVILAPDTPDRVGPMVGKSVKAIINFAGSGEPLLVKVGISAVSVEGARKNMDAELPGWDFDAVRQAASDAWERELGRIRVDGGTRDQRVTFYTALYHAMLTPNVYMDVDGQYRGRDLEVHKAEGFTYYSVFSLWDTFRALHPLLTLIDRARTTDFVKTMLRQYQDGGRLPVWELSGNETDTMIGYHAVPVITDAIMKGIPGIDTTLAFEAMVHSADEDRAGLDAYKRRGYIDGSDASEDVSRTLEYGFDDWCIAMVAQKLGRADEAARFFKRAQAWRNLFDPSTGFMRARVEGQWFGPFDPAEVNSHYTEANAWQYSFFVPQDVEGLIRAHGGDAKFAAKLDALFSADSKTTGRDQSDITGLVGQYAHGNEPSHHIAYLYPFAGQPWKTQAMVRRLMDTMYAPKPDGMIGNDDCGQMSAWFVLSALGFYEVTPGSDQYVIGSPIFPKATISLEGGKAFVVGTTGTTGTYVRSARLNGAAYLRSYLNFQNVAGGGELSLVMGETPNMAWGSALADRPRSAIQGAAIVAAPFVTAGSSVFRGRTVVGLGHIEPGVELRYTLDGSAAGPASPRYAGPITLADTTAVNVIARRSNGETSLPFSATFHKIPDGRRITLSAKYANQYNAGGSDALIDTLRGGADFRSGRWQGYLGTDLTAVVDLGSAQQIRRIAMGFLQDVGSWIVLPRRVRFEVSEDGVTYHSIGEATHDVSDRESAPVTRDLAVTPAAAVRARYVRVTVEHYGRLPDWHPGKGEESWFFADEIVIEQPLMTRWAKDVSPSRALPEYPRPQLVRKDWLNLNGTWDYAIRPRSDAEPAAFDGKILVPFPVESALSGVMAKVGETNRLWYHRRFDVPAGWKGQRTLLHFGAVDWEAEVVVNGKSVGMHRGGYGEMTFDITGALKPAGSQELVVAVWDPTDTGTQPRGKQVNRPGSIWYTSVTGIWQTVWIEPVPQAAIDSLVLVPDIDAGVLIVTAAVSGAAANSQVVAVALDGSREVGRATGRPGQPFSVVVPNAKLWSPGSPTLYALRVSLSGPKADEITSYFGMRKTSLCKDDGGVFRMCLNNKPLFQVGPLDQGWWPDGLYTAPTDDALRSDIEVTKQLGFNMARKHVKVEPDRWYYWADRLGLLVWQDMPSTSLRGQRPADSAQQFELELKTLIDQRRNHPSIVMWVPFNEGWGQYDTPRIVQWIKSYDPSRLVDNASGWTDAGAGDVHDVHTYPGPSSPKPEATRAAVLGEFGGLGLPLPGHTWQSQANWSYRGFTTQEALTDAYVALLARVHPLIGSPGLSAAVYTQTTDVEIEVNGLMTYDREIIKPNADRVRAANLLLFTPPPVLKAIVETSRDTPVEWRHTTTRPADNWFAVAFDAAAWSSGPGGFGTRNTPGTVVRTVWNTSDIWIRRSFDLPAGVAMTNPQFLIHHDEDAEVYLNGVFVLKVSGYTSDYETVPLTAEARAALKPSLNTIAVHCHQTTGGQYIDIGIVDLIPPSKR